MDRHNAVASLVYSLQNYSTEGVPFQELSLRSMSTEHHHSELGEEDIWAG